MPENRASWRSATSSFSFQSGTPAGENGSPAPSSSANPQRSRVEAAHLKEVSNLTQINCSLKAQINELQKERSRKEQQQQDSSTNIAKQHLRSAVASNTVLGKPYITKIENSTGECTILSDRDNASCSKGLISQIYQRCSAALQALQEPAGSSDYYVDLLLAVLSETLSTGGSLCGLYASLFLLICDRNNRSSNDMKKVIPPAVHILQTAMSLQPPGEANNCVEKVVFPSTMKVDFTAVNADEELPHADDEEIMAMVSSKNTAKTKSITSSVVFENGKLRANHHRYLMENYCTVALQSVIVGGGQQTQSNIGINCWSSLSTLVSPNKKERPSIPTMHTSSKEAVTLCQQMCIAGGGIGPVLLRQVEYCPEPISGVATYIIDAGLPRHTPVLTSVVLASVGFVRHAEKHFPNNRLLHLLMSAIKGFSALPPPSNRRAADAIEGLFTHIRCEQSYRQIYRLALNDAGAALKLIQDIGVRSEGGISATARKLTTHRPRDSNQDCSVDPKSLKTALEIAFFMAAVLKEPEYETYRSAIFAKEEEDDEEPLSANMKRSRAGGDSPTRRRPKMDSSDHTEADKQETNEMKSQMSYMCFFRVAEQASNLVIIMEKTLSNQKELAPLQECFTHAVIVLDSLLHYCPDISIYSHLLFAPVCIIDDFIKKHNQILTAPLSPTRLRVFSEAARRMTLLKENLRIR